MVSNDNQRRPFSRNREVLSTRTSVQYTLRSIDDARYELDSVVSYRLNESVGVGRLVVFATCSPLLRDSITASAQAPLFELWFTSDESVFHDSVEAMFSSTQISMRCTGVGGQKWETGFRQAQFDSVPIDHWEDELLFFRQSVGALAQQNVSDHYARLRIFECDLRKLADNGHPVASIDELSVRSVTLQSADDGLCFWHTPFPCMVDSVAFDVSDLRGRPGEDLAFQVVPFTPSPGLPLTGWITAEELQPMQIGSWLLPGNGVALLWRPNNPESSS